MQSRAFNFILSDAYRVELKTVALYARLLKEAGLLTTGARGVNAPNMTTLDAARMTIAMLATDSPSRASEMVRRFGALPYRADRSKGPHPEGLEIAEGATLEGVVTRLFAADFGPFKLAPYLEIQENARTARIEHQAGGAFFQDVERTPEQRDADAKGLYGVRRSRGLASAELMKVQTWFYLERRDAITWEERYRGCDENGHPLDPAHPWNAEMRAAERSQILTDATVGGLLAPFVTKGTPE